MIRFSLPAVALVLLGCGSAAGSGAAAPATTPPSAAAPATGEAVVRQMQARYTESWYRTLTFVQTTTRTLPNGQTRVETWYEAAAVPGRLRIDIAPIDSGNAVIYRGDTRHDFRGGELVNSATDRNLLLTLGFDVYAQPAEVTLAQLRAQGVDLARVHTTEWQGRPVYVVGAGAGDTTSTQFWVDQERLLFVRLIENLRNPNNPDAPAARLDVEFNKYRPLGGGWIAPEVIIRVNGREIMREEYTEMHPDVDLPAELFDTTAYRRPAWVSEGR